MISQEQINQVAAQLPHPNDRVKYIHLRKDILLEELQYISIDGKTFNGKNYLTATFGIEGADEYVRIRYDAMTVAYKQNQNGDIDVAVAFKSPNDDYVKRIGNSLAGIALSRYLESTNKGNHNIMFGFEEGYYTILFTLKTQDILEANEVGESLPIGLINKITASDLKNSLVVQTIKGNIYNFAIAAYTYVRGDKNQILGLDEWKP